MGKTETERYIESREERVAAADARTEVFERLWAPISERLIELADIKPADVVLDIGTGHGEPALTAAQVVGPGGRVVGTDFHAEILDVGRRRAAELGLTWAEFEPHNAEDLQFPEQTFDAAVSRLAFMFVRDVPKALRSILRVLKPGARYAIAVCGPVETQRSWCLMRDAIVDELGIEPPAPPVLGEPGTWALADLGLLERLFRENGFVDVTLESDDDYIWEFRSPEEIVEWHRYFIDASGLLDGQSPERRQAARDAAVERARAVADPDGAVRLTNQVLYAVGARPDTT